MRPTFGLAMIVRNAEKDLPRCLDSVRDLVDSIVVVDTGSVDRTVEIARSYGARVEEVVWQDRFDEPLNYALDLVEAEWTLRLDHDEWMLPESVEALPELVQAFPADLYTLIRQDLHPDGSISEMRMSRLFRTEARLRYVSRIHEFFSEEELRGRTVRQLDVRFMHDGFLIPLNRPKLERNLKILRMELEEHPDSLFYGVEAARTMMHLGDPAGAVMLNVLADRLIEFQDQDEMPDQLCGDMLASALDLIPPNEWNSLRTAALLRLARGWCSRLPGTTWMVAQLELKRGRLREALEALLDLEQMFVTDDYDRVGAFQRGTIEQATWLNLALVSHQLGRKEIARRNYQRVLARDPNHGQARQNLALL